MNSLLRYASFAFVMMLCVSAAFGQTLSEEERREGFRSMFNGKDLTGWRLSESSALPDKPSEVWSVADGVIKLSGKGGPNLGSQWDYEDFEMRFEWRALKEKYNSGYFIRSGRKVGSNQLNLAHGAEGRFFGGKMTGGPAVPALQKPAGEWNEWRTRVVGDKVSFSCNGKPAWEGTDFESKRGYIGLQTEGAAMEFRNLRIQEIGFRHLDEKSWKPAGEDKSRRETIDKFGDYVLRLEFKTASRQIAGIVLRGPGTPETAVVRFGDVPEVGSGGLVELGIAPTKKADVLLGQWNYLEVRLAGAKVTVWLNGEIVVDNKELKVAEFPKEGPLVLLPSGVEIQNVRVKAAKS
jgi:hypothetical protein